MRRYGGHDAAAHVVYCRGFARHAVFAAVSPRGEFVPSRPRSGCDHQFVKLEEVERDAAGDEPRAREDELWEVGDDVGAELRFGFPPVLVVPRAACSGVVWGVVVVVGGNRRGGDASRAEGSRPRMARYLQRAFAFQTTAMSTPHRAGRTPRRYTHPARRVRRCATDGPTSRVARRDGRSRRDSLPAGAQHRGRHRARVEMRCELRRPAHGPHPSLAVLAVLATRDATAPAECVMLPFFTRQKYSCVSEFSRPGLTSAGAEAPRPHGRNRFQVHAGGDRVTPRRYSLQRLLRRRRSPQLIRLRGDAGGLGGYVQRSVQEEDRRVR